MSATVRQTRNTDGAGYASFHHVYGYLQWLQIHHYNKIIYENNE